MKREAGLQPQKDEGGVWCPLVVTCGYCVQRWERAGEGISRQGQTGASQVEDLEEGLAVGKFIPLHADTDPHAQGS